MPSSCGSEVCGATAFLQAPSARHNNKKERSKANEKGAVDLSREEERVIALPRPECASFDNVKPQFGASRIRNFNPQFPNEIPRSPGWSKPLLRFSYLSLRFIAGSSRRGSERKSCSRRTSDMESRRSPDASVRCNGLTLWIKNGAFWHHPYVCFHGASITLG